MTANRDTLERPQAEQDEARWKVSEESADEQGPDDEGPTIVRILAQLISFPFRSSGPDSPPRRGIACWWRSKTGKLTAESPDVDTDSPPGEAAPLKHGDSRLIRQDDDSDDGTQAMKPTRPNMDVESIWKLYRREHEDQDAQIGVLERRSRYLGLLLDETPYTDIARYMVTRVTASADEVLRAVPRLRSVKELLEFMAASDILLRVHGDEYQLHPDAKNILEGPWGGIRLR